MSIDFKFFNSRLYYCWHFPKPGAIDDWFLLYFWLFMEVIKFIFSNRIPKSMNKLLEYFNLWNIQLQIFYLSIVLFQKICVNILEKLSLILEHRYSWTNDKSFRDVYNKSFPLHCVTELFKCRLWKLKPWKTRRIL